jgi:hypothetical protein
MSDAARKLRVVKDTPARRRRPPQAQVAEAIHLRDLKRELHASRIRHGHLPGFATIVRDEFGPAVDPRVVLDEPENIEQMGLPELAATANCYHYQAQQAAQSAVEYASHAGQALLTAKAQLRHGEWGGWLVDNFHGSDRTAQAYMQLASNPQRVADLGPDTSLHEALKALRKPTREPQPKPEPKATTVVANAMDALWNRTPELTADQTRALIGDLRQLADSLEEGLAESQ